MRKKIVFTLLAFAFIFYFYNSKKITIEDKIGQMLLVGFRGQTLPDFIKTDLSKGNIGGVILYDYDVLNKTFDRNISSPQQLKKLTQEINFYAKYKPFIAIDQEGGLVNRLKEEYGFLKTISQQDLGEKNNTDLTYENAQTIAKTLKNVGINLNFAPCVDLNINPQNRAIARLKRSFSADPQIVTRHATEFIRAHNEEGILTTLKHFPGHGSGYNDSHYGFVDLTKTWQEKELIPYEKLIEQGLVDIVMTAHIFNKNLDEKYPSIMSKNVIDGILRKKLNFDGVVISDCIQMKAISNNYSLEEVVVSAINAGVNIFLAGNNIDYDCEANINKIAKQIKNIILASIDNGTISEEQINNSYQKIIKLKEKLL